MCPNYDRYTPRRSNMKNGDISMKAAAKDRLLGLIAILISAVFAYLTSGLPATSYVGDPGPKMFPYIGCILSALCGLILIVRPARGEGKTFMTKDQFLHALLLFGIYVLYYVLLLIFGFTVTAPIILFIISLLFSEVSNPNAPMKSRIIKSLIYAVLLAGVLYLIYVVLLDTTIPKGILWKALKK